MGGLIDRWINVWKGLFDTLKIMVGRFYKNELVFFLDVSSPLILADKVYFVLLQNFEQLLFFWKFSDFLRLFQYLGDFEDFIVGSY